MNFYQIQSKFRDEIRPRFGVMRAREFIMKDAYSFHIDEPSLAQGYRAMYEAYTRIFTRMGLKFRAVQADGGSIGGNVSQEFHVLADSGEDAIAFSTSGDYASNLETATSLAADRGRAPLRRRDMRRVETPGARTIADLSAFLGVPAQQCVKTLMVEGADGAVVAMILRGDHELNAVKAQKLAGVANPLRMACAGTGARGLGLRPRLARPGGISRCDLRRPRRGPLADFVCGANEKDVHLTGVNWGRDLPELAAPSTSATSWRAIPARPATARWRSRAASRSATSSSSASSTARPCRRACSTSRARRSPCSWAATVSA